jgi:hypothetical protein
MSQKPAFSTCLAYHGETNGSLTPLCLPDRRLSAAFSRSDHGDAVSKSLEDGSI